MMVSKEHGGMMGSAQHTPAAENGATSGYEEAAQTICWAFCLD
jgi:hypothetical protein